MAYKPIHGMTGTREHKIWRCMRDRCYRQTTTRYKDYGGRGITICDEWRNDFMSFYKDMGASPSKDHSIDRIDNNGSYCKENCRWATRFEQQANSRRARKCEVNGVTYQTIGEAARQLGLHRATIQWRFDHKVTGYRRLP